MERLRNSIGTICATLAIAMMVVVTKPANAAVMSRPTTLQSIATIDPAPPIQTRQVVVWYHRHHSRWWWRHHRHYYHYWGY